VEDQMWINFKLYEEAAKNYHNFMGTKLPLNEDNHMSSLFFFLAPYSKTREDPDNPNGVMRQTETGYVVQFNKEAVKVIEALASPYSHALLKAHFERLKDESQQTPNQSSQEDL
jgi:hypothetical protein